VILGHVPKMILMTLSCSSRTSAIAIKEDSTTYEDLRVRIDQALVTDIEPDDEGKAAMNEINAAQARAGGSQRSWRGRENSEG